MAVWMFRSFEGLQALESENARLKKMYSRAFASRTMRCRMPLKKSYSAGRAQ